MPAETAATPLTPYLSSNHRASVAALGPDARDFFTGHGYTLARLARRTRVSPSMMQAFFAGRAVSARLVRNLAKLRAQLDARAPEAPSHAQAH